MTDPKQQPVDKFDDILALYEPEFDLSLIEGDLPDMEKDALRNLGLDKVLLVGQVDDLKTFLDGLPYVSPVTFLTSYVPIKKDPLSDEKEEGGMLSFYPRLKDDTSFIYKPATAVMPDYVCTDKGFMFKFQDVFMQIIFSQDKFIEYSFLMEKE